MAGTRLAGWTTALLVGAGLAVACGGANHAGDGTGGSAGAIPDGGDAGGQGGGAGDAATDGDAQGAVGGGGTGCVDIQVWNGILGDPADWAQTGPPTGVTGDRDHFWRDATGVHVAWDATHADHSSAGMVVSSFHAATGALLGNRFFPDGGLKGFAAAGMAADGTAALAVVVAPDDGGTYQALLMIRTADPSFEQVVPLPPWPEPCAEVGVGWDGQAFAVHGFGEADNVQYVTRVAEDGTIVLQPEAFGIGAGYYTDMRYATDPVSGVSVGIGGTDGDYIVGHQRDGTPIPDPYPQSIVPMPVQGALGAGGLHPAVSAVPGGAVVPWGAGAPTWYKVNTFLQPLDATLQPSGDVIGIAGEPYPATNAYDANRWLAAQQTPAGWWVAGANRTNLGEYDVVKGKASARRTLVSFSQQAQAQNGGTVFDARFFDSVAWHGEIWLGFEDGTDGPRPYRVVRADTGCTYKSIVDLHNGW